MCPHTHILTHAHIYSCTISVIHISITITHVHTYVICVLIYLHTLTYRLPQAYMCSVSCALLPCLLPSHSPGSAGTPAH